MKSVVLNWSGVNVATLISTISVLCALGMFVTSSGVIEALRTSLKVPNRQKCCQWFHFTELGQAKELLWRVLEGRQGAAWMGRGEEPNAIPSSAAGPTYRARVFKALKLMLHYKGIKSLIRLSHAPLPYFSPSEKINYSFSSFPFYFGISIWKFRAIWYPGNDLSD